MGPAFRQISVLSRDKQSNQVLSRVWFSRTNQFPWEKKNDADIFQLFWSEALLLEIIFMDIQITATENKDLISHYPNISRELDTRHNVP
jgi:hypothetical protein